MKRIVGGIKDENGIYLPISKDGLLKVETKANDQIAEVGLSLDEFLTKYLHLLHRETKALFEESTQGKLSKDSSQSLRDYLKLIMELKKQEKALLDDMSDEELEKLSEKNK